MPFSLRAITDKTWDEVDQLAEDINAVRQLHGTAIESAALQRFAESLGYEYCPGGGWYNPKTMDNVAKVYTASGLLTRLAFYESKSLEEMAEEFKKWRTEFEKS